MKETLKKVIPYSVRCDLRTAENAIRVIARNYRAMLTAKARWPVSSALRLNIGCGHLVKDGWVNIDVSGAGGTVYHDARDPFPIGAGSATAIHMEHFLEHLQIDHAERLLSECARVLQPGGRIRVIVPDAEKYLRAYVSEDENFFQPLERLANSAAPLRTPIEIINQAFRMAGDHKFAWDFEHLSLALSDAGFEEIERSEYGASPMDGDDWWRPHESLYINAVK